MHAISAKNGTLGQNWQKLFSTNYGTFPIDPKLAGRAPLFYRTTDVATISAKNGTTDGWEAARLFSFLFSFSLFLFFFFLLIFFFSCFLFHGGKLLHCRLLFFFLLPSLLGRGQAFVFILSQSQRVIGVSEVGSRGDQF